MSGNYVSCERVLNHFLETSFPRKEVAKICVLCGLFLCVLCVYFSYLPHPRLNDRSRAGQPLPKGDGQKFVFGVFTSHDFPHSLFPIQLLNFSTPQPLNSSTYQPINLSTYQLILHHLLLPHSILNRNHINRPVFIIRQVLVFIAAD